MVASGDRITAKTLFVHRKGNGGAFVTPSPAVLKRREAFWMVNRTECQAEVSFSSAIVDPPKASLAPQGGEQVFLVVETAPPGYYEYDVVLTCRLEGREVQQHAEGASRPGVIIDN